MPKVSVILPTYNRAAFIGRAVGSVLNQTYRDFELIIVDDGSTDDTEKIVKGFSDKRISYIKHEVNKGAAAARNTGLRIAKGELIAFLDSDDEAFPERLQKQVKIFSGLPSEVGVVYGDINVIEENGNSFIWRSSSYSPDSGILYNQFVFRLGQLSIALPTTMIRKVCFEKVGEFDERFHRLIDGELFTRISRFFYFYYMNEVVINGYSSSMRIGTDEKALVEAKELFLNKYANELSKDRKKFANLLYEIGHGLCIIAKEKKGKKYLLNAVKIYSLNPKYIAAALIAQIGLNLFSIVSGFLQKMKRSPR